MKTKPNAPTWDLWKGNCLELLKKVPDNHFHTIVTSIPYWALRDYQIPDSIWGGDSKCKHTFKNQTIARQTAGAGNRRGLGLADSVYSTRGGAKKVATIPPQKNIVTGFCSSCGAWRGCYGLEPTIKLYLAHTVLIFSELMRVLRKDGTLWLNVGDAFITKPHGNGSTFDPKWKRARDRSEGNLAGNRTNRPGTVDFALKHKDLIGLPWRVAFALQQDGWHLRSEIIWEKPNGMPESVADRPTRAHENLFLLSKSRKYFYDKEAIKERSTGNSHARIAQNGQPAAEQFNFDGTAAASGINPRARVHGPRSRFSKDADRGHGAGAVGVKRARQNESFSDSISASIVEFRNKRSIWRIRPEGFQAWMCRKCKAFFPRRINPDKPCPECGETSWISHFAVYPTALVEPCILAGTSEHGCCGKCGAPWTRITEKVGPKYGPRKFPTGWTNHPEGEEPNGHGEPYKGRYRNKHAQMHPTSQSARMRDNSVIGRENGTGSHDNPFAQVVTVGWKQTCKCVNPLIVACRVLDPFSGMGTTVMEAIRLGRSAVGIEISKDNVEMSRARILNDAPLFNGASMKVKA
jgi:DNA modification methylase